MQTFIPHVNELMHQYETTKGATMTFIDKLSPKQLGFPEMLNYFGCLEQGIIINNDGSLMKSFYYYCPDLEAALDSARHGLAVRMNSILMKLNTGWRMSVDTIRLPINSYPLKDQYEQTTLKFLENERRSKYLNEGYFETINVLTLTYKPTIIQDNSYKKLFIDDKKEREAARNMQDVLNEFKEKTEEICRDMQSAGIAMTALSSEELKRFIQYCICGTNAQVFAGNDRVLLNYMFAHEFKGGLTPAIDNLKIGCIAIIGFPETSYSGILDALSTLPFSYRVSNRFIFMDPLDAEKELRRILVHWNNRQFTLKQAIKQFLQPGSELSNGDTDALRNVAEVNQAINEAQRENIKYGYFTAVVITLSETQKQHEERTKVIKEILAKYQFPARIESINAIEAYLGSLPGSDTRLNLRRPILSTMNLSHLMPLTNVWKGDVQNPNPKFPKDSSALFQAVTTGRTPVHVNFFSLDLGNSLTIGSPGFGKTTMQSFTALQFLRYKDSQVFCFDNLMAQYAICRAVGGRHYEILNEDSNLQFCPLMNIDDPEERVWAAQFIEEIVTLQGIKVTPTERTAICDGIDALAADKTKTLSNLYMNIMDRNVRAGLEPFVSVKGGIMSGLMDAPTDNLTFGSYQVIDMGRIMQLEKRFSIPLLLYLFHRIDLRLDGRPTLIQLAETWSLLSHEVFATKINTWLRQLRAKNASVNFETHSIADILNSPLKDVILNACPTRIFLPNPDAMSQGVKPLYESFGLNDVQIQTISALLPKRHYYLTSPQGTRAIDLELSDAFLSFTGKNSKREIETFKQFEKQFGQMWPAEWLRFCGLTKEAEQWLTLYSSKE